MTIPEGWIATEATVTTCKYQFAGLSNLAFGFSAQKKFRITFNYYAHARLYSGQFQSEVAIPQNQRVPLAYNPSTLSKTPATSHPPYPPSDPRSSPSASPAPSFSPSSGSPSSTAAANPSSAAIKSDVSTSPPTPSLVPAPGFADLYTFNLSAFDLRLPLISASAVALCLVVGITVGHPGGALLSAGGAFTIGFGANQRIADSRLLPIIFAILATAIATLTGSLVGHRGFLIILFSGIAAAIYGVLSLWDAGLAWVGQQAAVALFVASAFPAGPRPSLTRAGLIAAGGLVQMLFTTVGLQLLPELATDIRAIHRVLNINFYRQRHQLFARLRQLPHALPAALLAPTERQAALIYATRLILTVTLASELYRRLGIQSGYWIPMTALLVQKPAFFETFTRGLLRLVGTLLGATLATHLASHMHLAVRFGMQPDWILAALTALFAFAAFATVSVNYGLYSICLTSYIVFLLSLNQIPGPEIAHRRAWCTAAGAAIAFLIHLDALRPHRAQPAAT